MELTRLRIYPDHFNPAENWSWSQSAAALRRKRTKKSRIILIAPRPARRMRGFLRRACWGLGDHISRLLRATSLPFGFLAMTKKKESQPSTQMEFEYAIERAGLVGIGIGDASKE